MKSYTAISTSIPVYILIFLLCSGSVGLHQKEYDLGSTNAGIEAKQPTVYIKNENGNYTIYRNGKPYFIKGAGGYGNLEVLAKRGGNSLRTWDTQNAAEILDNAQKLGLTVTLGLEIGSQWWGDNFDYTDPYAVEQKIKVLEKTILQYKDHPALLMWGVGNEVHLFKGDDTALWVTINRIAEMIHRVDPNHPTMTALSIKTFQDKREMIKMNLICNEIDVLAINPFGKIQDVFDGLYGKTFGIPVWSGPFIISEWSSIGPWEAKNTAWYVPVEPNSTEKANQIISFYEATIQQDRSRCLGSYVFYWGERYERTHTYFSLISRSGNETPSLDALQYLWTGTYPENLAPEVISLKIENKPANDGVIMCTDKNYTAEILASDPDGDSLYYYWELRHEGKTNNAAEMYNFPLEKHIDKSAQKKVTFKTPQEEGAYRLIVYIYDYKKHVAHANVPIYVLNECPSEVALEQIH
jgi:hypothetical protein